MLGFMTKHTASSEAIHHDLESSPESFLKALIFLTLGFAIFWCALNNWGPNQGLTLISGVLGLMIGALYLAKYFSAADAAEPALARVDQG